MTAEAAPAVHRAVVLPVDRDRAWAAITDADQLACWLADEVELDPRAGGAAVFRWEDGETRVGVVDELEERRRLVFRWRDGGEEAGDRVAAGDDGWLGGDESLVELTLDEVEGGTRVSVVEVQLTALRAGDATLAPAGTPSAWTPRMAALSACCAACWA